jgi:hypothetical protein
MFIYYIPFTSVYTYSSHHQVIKCVASHVFYPLFVLDCPRPVVVASLPDPVAVIGPDLPPSARVPRPIIIHIAFSPARAGETAQLLAHASSGVCFTDTKSLHNLHHRASAPAMSFAAPPVATHSSQNDEPLTPGLANREQCSGYTASPESGAFRVSFSHRLWVESGI